MKRWTIFDETYHTTKISKNSMVTIKVKDKDPAGYDLLIDITMDINTLVTKTRIEQGISVLFLNSLWKDELIG